MEIKRGREDRHRGDRRRGKINERTKSRNRTCLLNTELTSVLYSVIESNKN